MKLLLCYGTRAEYIKILPLIKKLKKSKLYFKVLYVSQHDSININFEYDIKINIEDNNNRLDSIISSCSNKLDIFKKQFKLTHVLVQGDTTSALAISISAFHNELELIHLEAGLRTYSREPNPEETNRRIISNIANIHLCPTNICKNNLNKERILGKKFVVGNTVIDNLLKYKKECSYENKVLVTLHRRENLSILNNWFACINALAEMHPEYEFIFPMHPNPKIQKNKSILKNIKVLDSTDHENLVKTLVKTKIVITDSGGIQEECSFLNKKCLVCRNKTERIECLNKNCFLVKKPNLIFKEFKKHHNKFRINLKCPYGNGTSADKIVKILEKL